jgi:branched-chain amino acid transport system ATP-binding protein
MTKDFLLQLRDVQVRRGGTMVLDGISLDIDEAEIIAVLGSNGSGKSTLLKSIFGLVPHTAGTILLHGKKIRPNTHIMIAAGIAYVPQEKNTFAHLTVKENLEIGGKMVNDRAIVQQRIAELFGMYPMLREKQSEKAKNLSGGQRQMLALARGLMTNPSLLLLDEPSAGLAPNLVSQTFKMIKEIRERHHTAIFIAEHNVSAVMRIANRAYQLESGRARKLTKL